LSCDGKTKNNFWLSEPKVTWQELLSDAGEEKKDNMKRRKEEEDCADN
jgi:hypothetical protein